MKTEENNFKLPILSSKNHLILSVLSISILISFIFLQIYFFKKIYFLIIFAAIYILVLRLLQNKFTTLTTFSFGSAELSFNSQTYQYSQIKGFNFDSNLTIKTLGIKMKDDKTTLIMFSSLKKTNKETLMVFTERFKKELTSYNSTDIQIKTSQLYRKQYQILKPIFWLFAVILLYLFGYAILKGIEIPTKFFYLPVFCTLLYLRLYN